MRLGSRRWPHKCERRINRRRGDREGRMSAGSDTTFRGTIGKDRRGLEAMVAAGAQAAGRRCP
jgi:hypothetical protein